MWLAQIAFLQALVAEGVADTHDIVFLDMDVLIVDSLAEVSPPVPAVSLIDRLRECKGRLQCILSCTAILAWMCSGRCASLLPPAARASRSSSAVLYSGFPRAAHSDGCTRRAEMLPILHAQIFANGPPFDYGVTLSDAVDMPVNLGMQFVPRGRYLSAIGFLRDVIAIYPFNETFIAGQVGGTSDPRLPQLTAQHDALLSFQPACSMLRRGI